MSEFYVSLALCNTHTESTNDSLNQCSVKNFSCDAKPIHEHCSEFPEFFVSTWMVVSTFLTFSSNSAQFLWKLKIPLYLSLIFQNILDITIFFLAYTLGRGINREGFYSKLALVKICSTWPLLDKYVLSKNLKWVFRPHRYLRSPMWPME